MFDTKPAMVHVWSTEVRLGVFQIWSSVLGQLTNPSRPVQAACQTYSFELTGTVVDAPLVSALSRS